MVRQERAEITRKALIRAAAECFDRNGYERASLQRISAAAGVSKGALSFHFSAKEELAGAVQERARAITRAALARFDPARASGGPCLQMVIDVTYVLARLLESDRVVRAAARLSREQDGVTLSEPGWQQAWAPMVRVLLHRASSDRSLGAGVDIGAVEMLLSCMLVGSEVIMRQRDRGPGPEHCGRWCPPSEATRQWLARIWLQILPGIASGETLPKLRAGGSIS
jgi:AcrR family transcriptional regulator